jgi:hypothetical protein
MSIVRSARKASSGQSRTRSHAEALANVMIGIPVGQAVLWVCGVPIVEALWLNVVMLGLSYARSYVIRRIFTRIG